MWNARQIGEQIRYQISRFRYRLNELIHGHIKIDELSIDYHLPEEFTSYHLWRNRIFIWVGASIIGLLATFFAYVCDSSGEWYRELMKEHLWLSLIICPVGLVFIRYLSRTVFKGAEGSGIPQVVAALSNERKKVRDELLSLRVLIGKFLGTMLGLACGASIGREGPTVQIGAAVLRKFGQMLNSPVHYTGRSLILAGGAAGVSAAFNTPLAGIVFAIEELSKSFVEKDTSILLMAVVIAGLAALSISGHYFYFGKNLATLEGFAQLYAVPIGVLGGLLGGGFSVMVMRGVNFMERLAPRQAYLQTAQLGLGIALLGILTHGATFGTGYEEAKAFLNADRSDFLFPFAKVLATVFSYMSGIPGGIFSPSLSIGAGLGSLSAQIFVIPYVPAVLLGMVSFFCGVIRAPITAIVIVAEMTAEHALLFPLMLASIAAYAVSNAVSKESLYTSLAKRFLGER